MPPQKSRISGNAFVLTKKRLKVTSEAYASLKIARNVEKSILHYFDNFDAALSVIISVMTRQFETFRLIHSFVILEWNRLFEGVHIACKCDW